MSAVLEEETIDLEAESAARERAERIQRFGISLRMKRTAAIRARASSGIETRWLADQDAYHGRDSKSRAYDLMDGIRHNAPPPTNNRMVTQRRSSQFVQKTRSKTNSAAAHVADILFPSEEKNWRLEPTPVPELMNALKHGGSDPELDANGQPLMHPDAKDAQGNPRPLTKGDIATDLMKVARDRCAQMEKEIDDQLVECQYNAEGRKVIDDAAQLGTGIMRGPIAVTRTKKKWVKKKGSDGINYFEAEITVDERPASNRVSPWNCYPAPNCGENIHNGSYHWEKELMSPAGLKQLAKAKGFKAEEIAKCLAEGPTRVREADDDALQNRGDGEYLIDIDPADKSTYEVWLYWGEVEREDLEVLGVEVDDDLASYSAAVVMCNDRVIRAMLNPSDMGEIPYDYFRWERIAGSPWGGGVPYLMRFAQAAINAAWRQMQDNAGLSHGPQIVMRRKGIEPADGSWDIYGNKLWFATGSEMIDVEKAFGVFHIENNQQPLQAILEIANMYADEETVMPQLMQGDQNNAPDKVGVARILANGASVMLKRYARNWDDGVTTPHLRRYYDWNMQYNENEDCKGDYFVMALGATHLVVKDQRTQDIANTAAMASNPIFAPYINPKKLAQAQVQTSAVRDVLYTDDELAENEAKAAANPPPADPKIEAAKIQQQGALQIAQMKVEGEIAAEQTEAQSEIKNQELRMIEAARNDERELAKMQLQLDLEILKMANEQKLKVEDIRLALAMKTMDLQAQRQQQAVDLHSQREQGNQQLTLQAQEQMGEFKDEKVH